jgi:NitT/TauT family transport system permease protein
MTIAADVSETHTSDSDEPPMSVAIDTADIVVSRTVKRPVGQRVVRGIIRALPALGVFVIIMGIWYAINASLDPTKRFLLPRPDEVITQGLFGPNQDWQRILISIGLTTEVAISGLVIAAVIGIAWAVGMSMGRWVERSTYPYAVILQTIPILAITPLIGFWFGFEFPARLVVTVMIALFPMVSNTLFGLQSVDRSQHELFQLQKAGRWTVLTKLMFPAALPSIFVGLRTSAGLAVVGAIVGDIFFQRGTPGIGAQIQIYTRLLESPQLIAAILASALLGVLMFLIFGLLSKLAVGKWYDPVK